MELFWLKAAGGPTPGRGGLLRGQRASDLHDRLERH
jgi:hypothetical protein